MAPASSHRRPRGRPSKESVKAWELDIKVSEDAVSLLRMGPSLAAFKRCERHRAETAVLLHELTRMSRRDFNRRL